MVRFGQLWIAIAASSAVLVAQEQPPSLKIYVHNNAEVPGVALARAQDRASEIFRQSGVPTRWYDCPLPGKVGDSCAGPLDHGEIVVLIVHDPKKLRGDVFGAAFLGSDGYGSQADVYFDRLQRLCRDWNLGLPNMIGYIIAHEIGHLLLGTSAHSSFGIMRARWDPQELADAYRGRLLFSATQSKAMQERLMAISSEAASVSPGGH